MVYKTIPKSVMERIPLYINYLKKQDDDAIDTISATIISQELGLGEVMVRKDLNLIAGNGKPKIGYKVKDLKNRIENLINNNKVIDVIIVGVGKIGEALVRYKGFEAHGFHIKQIFDNDVIKVGTMIENYQINSMNNLESYCQENNISMAIIAVNSESAQLVSNRLVQCGVKGILNFTNTFLVTPDNIIVRNIDIASQLMILSLEINNK